MSEDNIPIDTIRKSLGVGWNTVMRAVVAAAELVAKLSPTRVGIDATVMTTGRLATRRRQLLTALVCLDTSLVVAVVQGRDRAAATRLVVDLAPDAEVVACDLFSGFKSAADTREGAVVVADVSLDPARAPSPGRGPPSTAAADPRPRGHKHDPLFGLRRVLRVAQQRLDPATVERIFERLGEADTDDEVGAAWVAVDLLRRVYQAPDRTPPTAGS
ncbi:MAG TPA: hypothetical protein VHF25_13110 [Nitriliruptorales bacterium]|nr:hypothetical protein [Nitriliruptorales bacterium]